MGYLKNIGPKKYRIKYDGPARHDGKRQQLTETLRNVTQREAAALLAKREAAVANGEYGQDDITVGALYNKFIAKKSEQVKAGRFSQNSLIRYEALFRNYLGPSFGQLKVKELTRLHLSDTYEKWCNMGPNGRKVSARTVLHAHNLLRGILNWGMRRELVSRNAASLLTADELPRAPKPEPRALSEEQLKTLLSASREPTRSAMTQGTLSSQTWFYPAVAFAAYTGCRRGEVLALHWSDVDFQNKAITISCSLTARKELKGTKNGKSRKIVASDTLVTILHEHRTRQNEERALLGASYKDDGFVFAMADGSAIDPQNFGSAVKRIVDRLGFPSITLHDLRDTHASLLGKAGVPIEVLSKRLGHSTINVTMDRYLHVYTEQDAAAAEAFERLLG